MSLIEVQIFFKQLKLVYVSKLMEDKNDENFANEVQDLPRLEVY